MNQPFTPPPPTASPANSAANSAAANEDLKRVYQDVAERASKILEQFAQKQAQSLSSAVRDEMGIAKAFMDLYGRMASDPNLVAAVTVNWWLDSMRLWQ